MEILNALAQTQAGGQAQAASASLTDNFDTFLTLLTTQLRNQDPLEPLKSNEFTSQLVEFSAVEQSIATNQNLEQLLNLTFASFAGQAVSYIGKEVTAESPTAVLTDGNAQWDYELDAPAEDATLFITNAAGSLVHQEQVQNISGSQSFVWDGRDGSGRQLPDGEYTLRVIAADAADNQIPVTMKQKGVVSSVGFENNTPVLTVNGSGILLSDVLSVRDPEL